nr:hypothetical protein CFP56_60265 [Quercus suber]
MPHSCLPYGPDEEDRGDPDRFVDGSTAGQCLYEETKHYEQFAGVPNRDCYTGPMVKGRSPHDPDLSWTMKSVGYMRESICNPSSWMNETWGPAIHDPRPPRTREEFLPFVLRRSGRYGHPSATRRPSAQYGGAQTKGKDEMAVSPQLSIPSCCLPGRVEVKEMSSESSDEQSPLRFPLFSHERSGRLRCARCTKVEDRMDECFFPCTSCKKVAYCTSSCEEEDESDHKPFCEALRALGNKTARRDLMLSGRRMTGVENECSDISDDDDSQEDTLMDFGDTDATSTTHPIRGFRIYALRFVEFRVDYGYASVWKNAEELSGAAWTSEIEIFWATAPSAARYRELLDSPDGEHSDLEPGPYGRYVLHAVLEESRRFLFDVREFQSAADAAVNTGRQVRHAHELGPE